MKILVSTPTFLPVVGGAELGIHEIYSRLALRHDITIITPSPSNAALRANGGGGDYGDATYKVRRVTPRSRHFPSQVANMALSRISAPSIVATCDLLRTTRFDVANLHYAIPHLPVLYFLKTVARIPTMLSLVGRTDVARLLPFPRRQYVNAAIRAADVVAPISDFYFSSKRVPPSSETIPYGVNTSEFAPSRRDDTLRKSLGATGQTTILLSVQRLASVKRVDVLLQVFREVLAHEPTAILVLVGQGEDEEHLRQTAREMGIYDRVRFTGYVSELALPTYFASADVFVFHSLFETYGLVLAQALASGLPIVAARTSCIPEVVPEASGRLVTAFDVPAFTQAVLLYARERHFAESTRAYNRRWAVEHLDWDRVAERYERLLLETASVRSTSKA